MGGLGAWAVMQEIMQPGSGRVSRYVPQLQTPWRCTKRSLSALPVWLRPGNCPGGGHVTARNAKKIGRSRVRTPGSGTRASEIAPGRCGAANTDEPALQFRSWQRSAVQVAL